jgi:hypothetical protein
MLHIVSGKVSTRGKQIVGPPGYFIMGRIDGGMALVVLLCLNGLWSNGGRNRAVSLVSATLLNWADAF